MLDIEKDFKIVKKKDGNSIVFCHFEDLLMDFYNVGTMEEVKQNIGTNDEYIIMCPLCKQRHAHLQKYDNHKLYIKGDLTVGHCFVCGTSYINITDNVVVDYEVPEFSNFLMSSGVFEPVRLENSAWSIEKYMYEFDEYDEKGIEYLVKRNPYLSEMWKPLGIKFWNGNPVIPFYYRGEPVYYQIRFTGQNKIKYFLPPISAKLPYILSRENEARRNILIMEGVFDVFAALVQAPGYTPVAILGSSITDYEINAIRDYAGGCINKIKIWMDETAISMKIKEKLKNVFDYCPIEIIPSYGPDPEEVLNERIKLGQQIQWIS